MVRGKGATWLSAGAEDHELADPAWLSFTGATEVVGVDLAKPGSERTVLRKVERNSAGGMTETFTFKGGLPDFNAMRVEIEQREADLRLLRAIKAWEIPDPTAEINYEALNAFEDMLEALETERFQVLTPKQREWAKGAAASFGIDWETEGDVAQRNAHVPRGREVPMAFDVANLPKAPPGRKPKGDNFELLSPEEVKTLGPLTVRPVPEAKPRPPASADLFRSLPRDEFERLPRLSRQELQRALDAGRPPELGQQFPPPPRRQPVRRPRRP